MLKQSIGAALLLLAAQAYSAEITVTTTEDISKDDKECSLREAIHYINLGLPKEGYQGCGGENASAIILLTDNKTYVLNQHVEIKKSLTLKSVSGEDIEFASRDRVPGLQNATVKMSGKDNLFRVMSGEDLVIANFKEVNLEGCGQASCADQGGLIFNKGRVNFEHTKLFKGAANKGGAIYNYGIFNDVEMGLVEIKYSLIQDNNAANGAVLYSEYPSFSLTNSVIRNNTTTSTNSASVFSAKIFPVDDVKNLTAGTANIVSSTFLKNTGTLIKIIDGTVLNNLTIVDTNGTGLYFDAPNDAAYLGNSIILKNKKDCEFASADKTLFQNSLVGTTCGQGDVQFPNEVWSNSKIFAHAQNESEGKCLNLKEDSTSILCPYTTAENTFLGYIRPRILLSYPSIAQSVVINKGTELQEDNPTIVCESSDQRGSNRMLDNAECDRGAIEVIVPTSGQLTGQDINAGAIAKFSIQRFLGDSDLLPKEECERIIGKNPTGQPWQDGCLRIVQTKTESKGKTEIDLEGNVVYTPNSAWHGADIFEIQVVTSSTRFNKSKPYLPITTQIVQSPKNDMESKEVKTSGGAWGVAGLFALLSLIGLRRTFKD